MAREHDPVEERERLPARPLLPRLRRDLRLGVVVPALALVLTACKKEEPAPPAEEAPADTAATSEAGPGGGDARPSEQASAERAIPETESEMQAVPTAGGTRSEGETAAGPAEGAAGASERPPDQPSQEAEGADVAPEAPTSEAAAPAARPEASGETAAAPDTPPAAGESQPQEPSGGGQGQQASLKTTQEVYQGWKFFSANCERCHGQDALGSSLAPDLRKSISSGSVLGTGPVTRDVFVGTVVAGRPAKGMPAWAQLLQPEQINQIWAYLSARASGQLAAGRPIPEGS